MDLIMNISCSLWRMLLLLLHLSCCTFASRVICLLNNGLNSSLSFLLLIPFMACSPTCSRSWQFSIAERTITKLISDNS